MSGAKPLTQNLSKRRLWSGTRSLRSVRSCGMIVWDDQHFTRSLGSRSLLRKSGQGVTRSCLCCTRHPPCKIDVHVPFLATWNNASTMRHTRGNHDHFKSTQSTHATQNNENILAVGMHTPCEAAQLNHIERCDPTSSCIHFPYSPHRDHDLWRTILLKNT